MEVTPGIQTVLRLTLADGATGKFPRAFVYDPSGSLDDTVDLSHVANGMYENNWTPPLDVVGQYTAVFIVYSDSGHTIIDVSYNQSQESIDAILNFEEGAVWINSFYGGNDANPGTEKYPVATFPRAKIVADTFALRVFRIESMSEVLTQALFNYRFIGSDLAGVHYVGFNGQDISACTFERITVDGTAAGAAPTNGFNECLMFGPMAGMGAAFFDCYFLAFPGDYFALVPGAVTTFVRCGAASAQGQSAFPEVVTFTVSGNRIDAEFAQWFGDMRLNGMDNANSKINVDLGGGEVEVMSTCTAGIITIRGAGKVINNSGGATVIDLTTKTNIQINSAISESGTDIKTQVWWSRNGEVVAGIFSSVSAVIKNAAGTQVLDLGGATETGGRFAWTGLIATITVGDGFSLEVTADGEVFAIPFTRN